MTAPFCTQVWELPSLDNVPEASIENAVTWLLSDWGLTPTGLRHLGATSQIANDDLQAGTLVMVTIADPVDLRIRAPGVRGVRWRHLRDSPPETRSAVDHVLATIPLPGTGPPSPPAHGATATARPVGRAPAAGTPINAAGHDGAATS
ncbi:hypothetical protein [Amycolatopsis orientalis]|uniref:hypothetical protein n=1 Tax=Amycolatopsis orientalis TaxID=31958 RepID=UPI0012692420|nr:hypothetical protein [Amycolatopsis orientalis]